MSVSRRFSDSFGFQWQVCEVVPRKRREADAPGIVASDGRGSLYFFSRQTTRVLREYPPGWDLLTWSELEDLCARAQLMGVDRLERPTPRLRVPVSEARV